MKGDWWNPRPIGRKAYPFTIQKPDGTVLAYFPDLDSAVAKLEVYGEPGSVLVVERKAEP
jgi:hypothetical protein